MGWEGGDVLMLDSASLYNVDGWRRATPKASVSGSSGGASESGVLEKMLVWQEGPIPSAMTHVASELGPVAVQLFGLILNFMGGDAGKGKGKQGNEDAVKLVALVGKHTDLRDEAYAQLCKQTRGCPGVDARRRAWELLQLLASCYPPTHHFLEIVYDYCDSVLRSGAAAKGSTPDVEHVGADGLSKRLDAGFEMGPRKSVPTPDEVLAILGGGKLDAAVYYLNDEKVSMAYEPGARVGDALESLLKDLGVRDVVETFSLYVALRPPQGFRSNAAYAVEADMKLLDSKQYVADAIAESRGVTSTHGAGGAHSYCLLLKRRYFSELDEDVDDTTFIHLSYVQAQSEVLSGNYPVALGDSAQMAALMLQAELGDLMKVAAPQAVKVVDYLPEATAAEKSKPAWDKDIKDRWTAMRGMEGVVAKQHILHFLRSLPYGNASFYKVRPAEDPLKLFPSKLIMGVNKRGLHFFRPIPKEYLLSVDLKDIMQFGNSSSSVFFKIRIAGFLHLFQFDTRQGGDVCSTLQMFINEAMSRRAQDERGRGAGVPRGTAAAPATSAPPAQGNAVGPPPTPSGGSRRSAAGDDVDVLLKEKKKLVNKCEELEGEKQAIESMLDELMDRLTVEEKSRAGSEATCEELQKQVATLTTQLNAAKSEKGGGGSSDAALKADLAKAQKELQASNAAKVSAEAAVAKLTNEKKLVQNQLERAQKAHEQALQGTSSRVKEADAIISERDAQIRALEDELGAARADLGEVQELREFKSDTERAQQRAAELIAIQTAKLDELERSYKDELALRKQYFNQLQDLKGKIRVFARCRPLGKSEIAKGEEDVISFPNDMTLAHPGKEPGSKKEWDFDSCFPGTATQKEVFAEAKYLVQSAVDGFNVCIFAYGQTGSGKTHTIYGDPTPEGEGLTPRAVRELFSIIRRNSGKLSISVKVYMLELYLDNLQDLLSDPKDKATQKLEVKKTPKGNVTVVGAKVLAANSPEQLLEIIQSGSKGRHTSATKMNDESSRSHLVCSLLIESTNIQTQVQTVGKLSFVDLAGSERVKKSGAAGDVMKEAQSINKSLSALGDVISALSSGQAHIPYRNHKLTMLMSDSLGGNAKTLMFVACSPAKYNLEETQNSLQYATRVRTIKNDVTKQEESREVQRLRKAVAHWKTRAGESGDDLVDIADTGASQQDS